MVPRRAKHAAWLCLVLVTIGAAAWPQSCERRVQSAVRLRPTQSSISSAVEEFAGAALPDCMEAIIVIDVSGDLPDLQKAGEVLASKSHTVIVVVGMTTARDFDLTKLGFVHSGADALRSSITTAGTAKASTLGSAILLDVAPDSEADRIILETACSSSKAGRKGRKALSLLLHKNTRILSESGNGAHVFNPTALLGRLQKVSCETKASGNTIARCLIKQQQHGKHPVWCEDREWRERGIAKLMRCTDSSMNSHMNKWLGMVIAVVVIVCVGLLVNGTQFDPREVCAGAGASYSKRDDSSLSGLTKKTVIQQARRRQVSPSTGRGAKRSSTPKRTSRR